MSAVIVRLPHKARVMDDALALLAADEKDEPDRLRPGDMAVLWYLASNIDNESGEAVRRYATIAAACGVSRSTAVRAVARLKRHGLVTIRGRCFRDRRGKLATSYHLGGAARTDVGAQMNRGSVHQCTGNSSHPSRFPVGSQPGKQDAARGRSTDPPDWQEHARWLFTQGRYKDRFGYGALDLAVADIERLREEKGEQALLTAIENARRFGLHGERLNDFLKRTRARARPATTAAAR